MAEFGYAGKILKVDLSKSTIDEINTTDYADRFLGGRGVAAGIFWDDVSPETMAYDPENELIFITGPLCGFPRLSGSRWQICGKTPLKELELFSYANAGGRWGAWLKFAGYDGLVIRGKADKPVYIYIENGRAEIREASFLWGKTTFEVHDYLKTEFGRGTRSVAIGPAGENLVSFATVTADDNASASGGFGGVMGSKMLKSIAVRAEEKKRPLAANPEGLNSLCDKIYRLRMDNLENLGPPTPDWSSKYACFGCIGGCQRVSYRAEDRKSVV
jgi:aldehyde:ferredoxin oxidoreductase